MTSTHTKIDSKGINHSPSSVHFTAVLKSPEQLGPPRCIGPVYPRLRVLSALPFHGQFARREENPTGHLRYVSTRSEKHINTNMSSTGRQKLIWAHLSWESLYCKICKCHRYLPVQQKLLFNAPLVLNSLKSVHETLSQERQKLQAVWDANNMHQSNTLAQVRFVIWTLCPTLSCLVFYTWWLIFFVHSFFFFFPWCQPEAVRHSSQGPPSVADSAAEYFDASDDILWGSSSEVSDESGLSDGSTTNSEPEEGHSGYTSISDQGLKCIKSQWVFFIS